ncbi:MAG: NFACT RNA binding domain-containing protein [Candidatus Pacearchaeota archaeon]|nr:NFACT RNA binding domain-containing protein [Candidatus Pacearchaeota archaeon]
MKFDSYKKYKWFFTSGKKLVVGGKSAEQNDGLLNELKNDNKNYYVMHTRAPGSPFSVIVSDMKKIIKSDLDECAIFTGCFSRAWKEGKKKVEVDIFSLNQIKKDKSMKTGTWKVSGEVKRVVVDLRLALTKQENILRAVPEKTVNKEEVLAVICPGKIDKKNMVVKIAVEINDGEISKNEILAALPAGGVRICR